MSTQRVTYSVSSDTYDAFKAQCSTLGLVPTNVIQGCMEAFGTGDMKWFEGKPVPGNYVPGATQVAPPTQSSVTQPVLSAVPPVPRKSNIEVRKPTPFVPVPWTEDKIRYECRAGNGPARLKYPEIAAEEDAAKAYKDAQAKSAEGVTNA